jgi:HEAT repeat protein
MNNRIIIKLIIYISISTVCLSDVNKMQTSFDELLEDSKLLIDTLKSSNERDREKANKVIREQHEQLIDELIEIVSEKLEPNPSRTIQDNDYIRHHTKYMAIIVLGDLRSIKAVPMLLENLEYKNPNILVVTSYLEEGQLYIAAEALSKIGMPAVGPTLDKLCKYEKDERGRRICCWILKKILGDRLAQLRLQIAIEETRDEAVKKNLIAALPYFKTEQEKAAEERAKNQKTVQ